jgi:hypothetical protein
MRSIHTVALSLSKGTYRLGTLRQAQCYGIIQATVSIPIIFRLRTYPALRINAVAAGRDVAS